MDVGASCACKTPWVASVKKLTWSMEKIMRNVGILVLSALLSACATERTMMPTPNLHLEPDEDIYSELSEGLRSTEVKLFYVTDRVPEQDENGNLTYGFGRSPSLGFGTAVVDLGEDITWQELVEASRTRHRLKPVNLQLGEVTELVRGPDSPLPYKEVDDVIVEEPSLVAQRDEAAEQFRRHIVDHLALTPRKEVFLYVHGYHNSFEDAVFAMAELWHFLGRIGVPLVYTWPAGYPGIFGYTYDRESSEFTVYHMRQVLGFIASFPEVERINVIAHSRGTDVAVATLRELTIAARAQGLSPRKKYKLHNFVLAAPDIDLQVAEQRVAGDQLTLSAERFTVYTSPVDKAIGAATTLFSSPRGRVGTYDLDSASEQGKTWMELSESNLSIINFSGTGDSAADTYGHSYFRDAPTVSSDLVLMLRDDLSPGTPGRPLEHLGLKFWKVPDDYPPRE